MAPHTLYTIRNIGSFREARVQWFAPDGKLKHEIDADCADVENQGFVSRPDSGGWTYTSVANPSWEIYQPGRQDSERCPYGEIMWSADGRMFVHSSCTTHSPEDKWPHLPTTIEIFIEGKRKMLGPYPGATHQIHLDASGALAVHFQDWWLIVFDRKGRERFRDTIPVTRSRIVGCNDHGFLIGRSDESSEYHGFDGTISYFTIHGGYFSLWAGDHRALFNTKADSLLLVDCPKGQVIWRRLHDGERIVSESQAYAVVGPYLVTAAVELGPASKQPRWPKLDLRAVDLQTGKLVASWGWGAAEFARQPRFFEREGTVLFLYGSRLSELDPEDIRKSRQGWRSNEPPKPTPPRPDSRN